jgi:hypothetical protein
MTPIMTLSSNSKSDRIKYQCRYSGIKKNQDILEYKLRLILYRLSKIRIKDKKINLQKMSIRKISRLRTPL